MAMDVTRNAVLAALLFIGCGAHSAAAHVVEDPAAQAGMLDVASVAPAIHVDMRYATTNNFTGAGVPGYLANVCYLKADAAQALARVQAQLATAGYQLHIFDCYRPVQAVKSFVQWAYSPADPAGKRQYFPRIEKPALLNGYISATSGHSRGYTVDLSVRDCRRGTCQEMDMGTPFDFFDTRANTDTPGLSPQVLANRRLLLDAMAAQGFANYPMEWWHFTYQQGAKATEVFDFPVR